MASCATGGSHQVKVCAGEPQYVFTTLKEKPLQNRYVQAMLARYVERAGITKTSHRTR